MGNYSFWFHGHRDGVASLACAPMLRLQHSLIWKRKLRAISAYTRKGQVSSVLITFTVFNDIDNSSSLHILVP
jgi:hypothetical protein